jgi:hypothetical protein
MKKLAIFLVAILSTLLYGQAPEAQQSPQTCGISEMLNRGGWRIPGLSKVLPKKHGQWTTGGLENVFVEFLQSSAPKDSVVLISAVRGHVGTIEFREQAVDVTEILRFEMNGHVFAYRVTAVPVSVGKNGSRSPLGSEERLAFYDVDGSGRFTVMRDAGGFEPFVPFVPEWVKQSKKPS